MRRILEIATATLLGLAGCSSPPPQGTSSTNYIPRCPTTYWGQLGVDPFWRHLEALQGQARVSDLPLFSDDRSSCWLDCRPDYPLLLLVDGRR